MAFTTYDTHELDMLKDESEKAVVKCVKVRMVDERTGEVSKD